ncbi:MAG: EAL domain-containing protein [Lachnospiraceae bacterium]|nr:EAL domain-containing protein [Lachnospiraceae bacterium]
MNKDDLTRLDEIFEAFSIIAEGSYVFLCYMDEDYSRWSKSAVDYFGLPDEYMYEAGKIWEEHIHPDDVDEYRKSIRAIINGTETTHDMQYRARALDGSYCTCTCKGVVMHDYDGTPRYFGGCIKNHGLTSYVDSVTGLRSLYGFFEDMRTMFWKRNEGVIIQIGISNFSVFNDIHGYTFGNRILQSFARLLQKKFTNVGSVYRMDGTKFAVITHETSLEEIAKIYSDIHRYVSENFFVDEHRINLMVNAGDILVDNFEISDKTVYSCLKYAYYESKNAKMGELYTFKDALNENNRIMLEKLNVIRSSVSDNCKGFFLCYQPIMFADSQKLKGVEALIRWRDDKYGIVPPIQFIPVLEQDAIFPSLGRWILRQAMTDGRTLLESYPGLIMNINLSYAQLEKEGFVMEVLQILEETGFPAENLCLEITERCRLIDMGLLYNMIELFHGHGIKIALDDFGTGFSTIGILRDLPIDTVKIDRSFVMNIESSKADQITVRSISNLAEAFEAEVCVEGVETQGMVEQLSQYKVDSLQGYFYSKPIPIEEFIEMDFLK